MLYKSDTKTRDSVLKEDDLEDLFTKGGIMFPVITEEEIQDRSKSDGLTKAIAIFQTTWFVTQCIARYVQGLAITELEIITLAFATLNGLMYFFWWDKPLAVRHSVPVFLLEKPWAEQFLEEENKPSKLLCHIFSDMFSLQIRGVLLGPSLQSHTANTRCLLAVMHQEFWHPQALEIQVVLECIFEHSSAGQSARHHGQAFWRCCHC